MKKVLAILLSMVVLLLSVTVSAAENNHAENKLSKDLLSLVENLSDDDTINVNIWFKNVDKKLLRNSLVNQINHKENATKYSSIIVDNLSELEDNQFNSLDEYHVYSRLYRNSRKSIYKSYNFNMYDSIIKKYRIHPEIIYSSIFTPSILLNISKKDLDEIKYDERIQGIYYYEEPEEDFDGVCSNEPTMIQESDLADYTANDYGYWQRSTNINTLRDAFSNEGCGVNVALVEGGYPDEEQPLFDDSVNHNRLILIPDSSGNTTPSNHATLMASIIIGLTEDYEGVAPLANLYCISYSAVDNSIIATLEYLLDNYDIDIINLNVIFRTTQSYNTYAMYLDSLVSDYSVTICKAAGNDYNRIYDMALAYNVITVGNIDDHNTLNKDDDVIASSSSYYNGTSYAFKPDISAPGQRAKNPYSPTLSNGGTCASTAIMSGVCALLIDAFPTLVSKPMLLKSSLLASAYNLPNMTDVYSTSTSTYPAIDRQYGTGMVDAAAAYLVLSNHYYKSITSISEMENTVNSLEFRVYSRDITNDKDIFATVNWIQDVTYYSVYGTPYVLPGYHHELRLYDPNGNLVARSTYTNDRKQFIRYKPTQTGLYTLSVYKTGTPHYRPQSAIAYYLYHAD